jgi:hypothetical protein
VQGKLSEFTMAELLQLFALAERTGTLLVSTDRGSARVLLESGRVTGIGMEDYNVHAEIVECELLPMRTGASLGSITPSPDTPGLSFIVRNLVEPERWDLFARRCVEQQIYPFLALEHGDFQISIERVPFCPIALSLSVQQLVLDGSRWESEMEDYRREGYGARAEFKRGTVPPVGHDVGSVDWLIWSVLDHPDTIGAAAKRVGIPELDATAAVKRQADRGWLQRA